MRRSGLDHDDALGGHADLALVHEGTERGGGHGLVQVGIFQHQQRCLAAQFQQAGLQVPAGEFADDAADTRLEPVKFTRLTAGWAMSASTTAGASAAECATKFTTPGRQSGFNESIDDEAMHGRGRAPRP